jgi:hypothetical protein
LALTLTAQQRVPAAPNTTSSSSSRANSHKRNSKV